MPPKSQSTESADTKAQRTRVRILDAAAQVLSEKGYAGARLADIAELAELRAPAIYYYFNSRDDLIEEVMFCGISDLRSHLQNALAALPPNAAAMARIMTAVESHLRHELELSDYARASIRNSGQIPEHLKARQKREEALYDQIWRELIKDAAADGQVRSGLDAPLAQALILGALNWSAEWSHTHQASIETIVVNAQLFVRHSLNPAPARAPAARDADPQQA